MFKFTGFTQKANNAVNAAIAQASSLGHTYVGSEHLLCGLLREGSVMAYAQMRKSGASCEAITAKLLETVGRGSRTELSPENFTPKARRILENALMESKLSGLPQADTEQILLCILKEQECYAFRFLKQADCDLESLLRELSGITAEIAEYQTRKQQKQTRTPNLDKYGRDLTRLAKERRLDPVIGREKELARVTQILARRMKNNPCLIGDAGVGKTAIAEGLAQKIAAGDVPEVLRQKRVIALDLPLMVAGAKYRGDFEERMKSVMEEVAHSGNVVIFIDEIHTLIGTGAAEGAVDASNLLKPQLARGEFQMIGATTTEEYRRYIEKDQALERRFQSVLVPEPDEAAAVSILEGLKDRYESFHHVFVTRGAIEAAVRLSIRYLPEHRLPDKAIDLMDEACSRAGMKPCREECGSLPEVTAEDIAAVLSLSTGIDAGRFSEDESAMLMRLEETLHRRVAGQERAVSAVAKAIRRNRAGLREPKRPIGSFLFIGPTGVGKTELAKALAEALFGTEESLTSIDMTEYAEPGSVAKLIGSPPGYVGYDDAGGLTEKIRRRPYSVVLFDEIEKAHPDVLNLLLQLLDEGRLTDSHGRKVDFRNCVIILTSNVGAKAILSVGGMGFSVTNKAGTVPDLTKPAVMAELRAAFRPEFLNRLDEVVPFDKLGYRVAEQIAHKMLAGLRERLSASGIEADFSPDLIGAMAKLCSEKENGARPMKKFLRDNVEDPLSEQILSGGLSQGDRVCCGWDGALSFRKANEDFAGVQA